MLKTVAAAWPAEELVGTGQVPQLVAPGEAAKVPAAQAVQGGRPVEDHVPAAQSDCRVGDELAVAETEAVALVVTDEEGLALVEGATLLVADRVAAALDEQLARLA